MRIEESPISQDQGGNIQALIPQGPALGEGLSPSLIFCLEKEFMHRRCTGNKKEVSRHQLTP
jgi:hypothetical protein